MMIGLFCAQLNKSSDWEFTISNRPTATADVASSVQYYSLLAASHLGYSSATTDAIALVPLTSYHEPVSSSQIPPPSLHPSSACSAFDVPQLSYTVLVLLAPREDSHALARSSHGPGS